MNNDDVAKKLHLFERDCKDLCTMREFSFGSKARFGGLEARVDERSGCCVTNGDCRQPFKKRFHKQQSQAENEKEEPCSPDDRPFPCGKQEQPR